MPLMLEKESNFMSQSTDESSLYEKLRKIEALFAGAATVGERTAAGEAAERIRARLREAGQHEKPEEMKFSIPDPWSRRLFVALCRRYGLNPLRYSRMHRQSLIVKMPRSFLDDVLWPEFKQVNAALSEHLASITDRIIKTSVFSSAEEAEEKPEPLALAKSA
jgi:hypothetical protein